MAADFESTIGAFERDLAAAGELPHGSRVGTLDRLVDRIEAHPTLHRSRACALLVDASIAYYLASSESEKGIGPIALAVAIAEQIDVARSETTAELHREVLAWSTAGYERAGQFEQALQLNRELVTRTLTDRARLVRLAASVSVHLAVDPSSGPQHAAAPLPDANLEELQRRFWRLLPAVTTPEAPCSSTVAASGLAADGTLTSRLLELKQLSEAGLISHAEYDETRQTVLAAFARPPAQ